MNKLKKKIKQAIDTAHTWVMLNPLKAAGAGVVLGIFVCAASGGG